MANTQVFILEHLAKHCNLLIEVKSNNLHSSGIDRLKI